MNRVITGLAAVTVMLAFTTGAVSQTSGQDMSAPSMRVFGQALPPIGHVDFCRRYPHECLPTTAEPRHVDLTSTRWRELNEVNDLVNRMIEPATDWEVYGKLEYWAYPYDGRGDCEDYALLKQRLLMERGWPRSALPITVVRDTSDEGHAVLMARTVQGDFILDNKRPDVEPWHATPYAFLKRQSAADPRIWQSLSIPEAPPAARVSGTWPHWQE